MCLTVGCGVLAVARVRLVIDGGLGEDSEADVSVGPETGLRSRGASPWGRLQAAAGHPCAEDVLGRRSRDGQGLGVLR